MSQQTFLKVPFVWEKSEALIEVPSQLDFEPVEAIDNRLISSVTQVMAESVDASDRHRASEHDPCKATETFLNSAKEDFAYQNQMKQEKL